MEDNTHLNECCKQEENQSIKFVWSGLSKDDEGGYEPLYVYCTSCKIIIKWIGVGGYWSTLDHE